MTKEKGIIKFVNFWLDLFVLILLPFGIVWDTICLALNAVWWIVNFFVLSLFHCLVVVPIAGVFLFFAYMATGWLIIAFWCAAGLTYLIGILYGAYSMGLRDAIEEYLHKKAYTTTRRLYWSFSKKRKLLEKEREAYARIFWQRARKEGAYHTYVDGKLVRVYYDEACDPYRNVNKNGGNANEER